MKKYQNQIKIRESSISLRYKIYLPQQLIFPSENRENLCPLAAPPPRSSDRLDVARHSSSAKRGAEAEEEEDASCLRGLG